MSTGPQMLLAVFGWRWWSGAARKGLSFKRETNAETGRWVPERKLPSHSATLPFPCFADIFRDSMNADEPQTGTCLPGRVGKESSNPSPGSVGWHPAVQPQLAGMCCQLTAHLLPGQVLIKGVVWLMPGACTAFLGLPLPNWGFTLHLTWLHILVAQMVVGIWVNQSHQSDPFSPEKHFPHSG